VAGTPGRDFEYVNANVNLIAGILRQATGEQAEAFAERTLFRPLGIEKWNWDPMKTQGYNLMDGSLRLLPRDMAKLGQMMLDGGTWQGTRVVSQDWVQASTTRYLDAGEGPEGYGYLWWLMEAPGPEGERIPAFFANGWGSQFIVVFPTLDLLVVTTGGNEYNGKHLSVADALVRYLLPAVHPE
jgi:CubicO group peptidase (beta-lactamase class C family)